RGSGIGWGRSPVEESKRHDKAERPRREQQQQRKRAVETEEALAAHRLRQTRAGPPPTRPRIAVEQSREPQLATDSPRQDYSFKGIPKKDERQKDSHQGCCCPHQGSSRIPDETAAALIDGD